MTLSRPHDPFSSHVEALNTVSSPATWRAHQADLIPGVPFTHGPAVDMVIVDDPPPGVKTPPARVRRPARRRTPRKTGKQS